MISGIESRDRSSKCCELSNFELEDRVDSTSLLTHQEMGLSFVCPLGDLDDLDTQFQLQAAILPSVSPRQQQETTKPPCSGRFVMEVETKHAIEMDREKPVLVTPVNPESDRKSDESDTYLDACSVPEERMYHAALKLQKVYRSFRTRRQLADCAVLAEQRWWKLLDFAELKRSSISFFDIGKQETAHSRWFRARKRAAKVGKGLSKHAKARKLALQHWLEAIDPRHRYGHNLQFYYANWLHCQSREPFFYWLDIGEGKEVNLERCCRSKLQQQCIKYLGPTEREDYEVVVKDERFLYKQSSKLLDTSEDKAAKWIFVLSVSRDLYVGKKSKGMFQHSSFLAGGATLSAGRLVVEDGVLKAVWPHSGHYLPTEENFLAFMSYLKEHNVDLTNVQKTPFEEDEQIISRMSSRSEKSEAEALQKSEAAICSLESVDSSKQESDGAENANPQITRLSRGLLTKISKLQIPTRDDMVDIFKPEMLQPNCDPEDPEHSGEDGYETAEECLPEEEFTFTKVNLFGDDSEEADKESIPKEKIMKRIDSHNKQKSYQLAQQLSSRWSTGAGPRISCMRDYPLELQNKVLEQTHLSPRTSGRTAIHFPWAKSQHSRNVMTPTVLFKETEAGSPPAPLGALPKPATP